MKIVKILVMVMIMTMMDDHDHESDGDLKCILKHNCMSCGSQTAIKTSSTCIAIKKIPIWSIRTIKHVQSNSDFDIQFNEGMAWIYFLLHFACSIEMWKAKHHSLDLNFVSLWFSACYSTMPEWGVRGTVVGEIWNWDKEGNLSYTKCHQKIKKWCYSTMPKVCVEKVPEEKLCWVKEIMTKKASLSFNLKWKM